MKRRHELWIKTRLHHDGHGIQPGRTLATLMGSADQLWELLDAVLGWQVGMPEGLTVEEEDLIDNAMQVITDWARSRPTYERRASARHETRSGRSRPSWIRWPTPDSRFSQDNVKGPSAAGR